MVNCKDEFLKEIEGHELLCAMIKGDVLRYYDERDNNNIALLPIGFSEDEYELFLEAIDYDYEGRYSQVIIGTIWYKDGTWSERGEYDGSEWWAYKHCPPIPEELNRRNS